MKHPPATELLASVAHFLRDDLLPSLSGSHAFNLRVSINALDLVRREIELQAAAEEREHSRLAKLLGRNDELEAMRQELCEQIASGKITLDRAELREHLRATTLDRLAIDQPNYSAYVAAVARSGSEDERKKDAAEE